MEYQPVAINEVLAYQFQTKIDAPTRRTSTGSTRRTTTPRMLVELVNMLTKDAIAGNNPDTSDLDLAGWDFVVLPDDAYGRPDPFTGQIPSPAGPFPAAGLVATGYPLVSIPARRQHGDVTGEPLTPPHGAPGAARRRRPAARPPSDERRPGHPARGSTTATPTPRHDHAQVYYYVFGNPPPQQRDAAATRRHRAADDDRRRQPMASTPNPSGT